MVSLSFFALAGVAQAYTIVDSGFLMRKNIDPIVVPGQYNSHMHSFFGSDAVTANTTTSEELRQGCHTNANQMTSPSTVKKLLSTSVRV